MGIAVAVVVSKNCLYVRYALVKFCLLLLFFCQKFKHWLHTQHFSSFNKQKVSLSLFPILLTTQIRKLIERQHTTCCGCTPLLTGKHHWAITPVSGLEVLLAWHKSLQHVAAMLLLCNMLCVALCCVSYIKNLSQKLCFLRVEFFTTI